MDKITLDRIQTAHPQLRIELMDIYEEICEALKKKVICRFPFVHRTFEKQNELYAQGRTAPGAKVTNAKGGDSYHNYGLAVDIVLLIDKDGNGTFETASWDNQIDVDGDGQSDWMEIVAIFKRYGWEWGGDWKFKDTPHFQKTFGFSIQQLKEKYGVYPINVDGIRYPSLNQIA